MTTNDPSYFFLDEEKLNNFGEVSLGYENIAIKQKKNVCKSRLDVNVRSEVFKDVYLDIPLIASNMSTVTNASFAIELRKLGALGVLHRAQSLEDQILEVKTVAAECDIVAASIGVGEGQLYYAKQLILNGANVIFIDVAHGYSDYVLDLAKQLKAFSKQTKVVVGNTTNVEMLREFADTVDGIKVGIAQGFACETKNTAGCTEKQFSATLKFKGLSKSLGVPIISDGGTREPADFTKAIAAGANSVMAGKIFAACPESAAETVSRDGREQKLYAGMASSYVQNKWRGGLKDGTCSEGGVRMLDVGESLEKLLTRYSGALKSGITYAGGKDIESFQNTVEFVRLA